MKLRHEIKHVINYADCLRLRYRLQKLFPHDSFVDAHGEYRVRSLYFDNARDNALMEKINGVRDREKFRVRYYGNDISFIRLEKKIKKRDLCAKKSTLLDREQTQKILCGETAWMADSEDGLVLELYSKIRAGLRPKTIVDYIREPFVFAPGNVRITIDRDIRTGLRSIDFFGSATPLLPAHDGLAVLEVKYDAFLPDIVRDAVQIGDRKAGAFSKYAACRRFD